MSGQSRGSGETWYSAFDSKSGMPYYYNKRGDTTFERPAAFRGQPATGKVVTKNPKSGSGSGGKQRVGASDGGRSNRSDERSDRSNGSGGSGGNRISPSSGQAPSKGSSKRTKLRALYPHVARYEDELTLKPGQLVEGIQRVEGGTWWYGEANGRKGHFPANFVEEVRDLPKPKGRQSFLGPLFQGNGREQAIRDQNYGGASPGWLNQQAAPQRPEKPNEIAVGNVARSPEKQQQDEKKLGQGKGGGAGNLKYSYWAHLWGYCFSFYAVVLGAAAFLWFEESKRVGFDSLKAQILGTPFDFTGPAVAGAGLISFFFEYRLGLKKTDTQYAVVGGLPYRALLYAVLSVPCFTSYATILAGAIGVIASGVNYFTESKRERGTGTKKAILFRCSPSIFMGWSFAVSLTMVVFIVINAALFVFRFIIVEEERQLCILEFGDDETKCLSEFAAYAKGFGTSLDLTCALIVVPVLRAFIKSISTIEVSPSRTLATVIPLKKNIQGHKMIAFSIFIGGAGHTVAHFLNFAFAPEPSLASFGAFALFTGGFITLFMTIIFVAAHDSVRRSSFEVFWWSHHFFLLVFPLCLAHGPKYWFAAMITIPLYALDRLVRARRGTKNMLVDYVRFSSPVLKLHFFPERKEDFMFREGQYLFIQCPFINDYEWHPFTISSCFGDLEKEGYVSLHIRVQAKGSWTWQLMEYFKLLAGKGDLPQVPDSEGKMVDPPFESYLTHFDSAGIVQRGKLWGPDGKTLIRIDGPHSAPAQTYSTYKDVMLVGSGIGLTPSAAILSAVTRYKWAKGFQPETLRFFWVVRHSEINSFEWFIELIDNISRRVVADRKAGAITPYHRLEINIYVTSVPSDVQVESAEKINLAKKNDVKQRREKEINLQDAGMLDTYIGFNVSDIKQLIKNPTVDSKEQARMQYGEFGYTNKLPNRLGYIYVYNGRPMWDDIFPAVRESRHRDVREIGVCYCGAPNIGEDLKVGSHKYTTGQCKITLNKEVF